MHRRDFLKASLAGAAGLALPAALARLTAQPSAPPPRPNIIFFLTDDQAFDHVGYASAGAVQTPHLDAMARNGMIFNNAYVNAMPCIPSRACIMSGLHYHRYPKQKLGLLEGLKENTWTWARALKAAGYRTALIGKMHFQPMRSRHGFHVAQFSENKLDFEIREQDDWFDDHTVWLERQGVVSLPHPQPRGALPAGTKPTWLIPERTGAPELSWKYPTEYHPTTWIRDRAIAFLEEQKSRPEPFALVVSVRYPHPAYEPAPPYDTMYDPNAVVLPTEKWEDLQNAPLEYTDAGKITVFGFIPTWNHRGVPYYRNMTAAYNGSVSQFDAAVGEIMKHVNPANTLCLFGSDHGDYMGKRGRIYKSPLIPFDAIAKSPFLAYGYGVPKGSVCNQEVSFADLAPTFLQAAGLAVPADLDGTPLQNYFANPDHLAQRSVYCYGGDGFDMVRRDKWKYYRHHITKTPMLFDMDNDPGEWNNLAGLAQHKAQLDALSVEMDAVFAKPPAKLPLPDPAKSADSWQEFM